MPRGVRADATWSSAKSSAKPRCTMDSRAFRVTMLTPFEARQGTRFCFFAHAFGIPGGRFAKRDLDSVLQGEFRRLLANSPNFRPDPTLGSTPRRIPGGAPAHERPR